MRNRAERVITGKSYEIRSIDILNERGWQPLIDGMKTTKIILIYKVRNNCVNQGISQMFEVGNNHSFII